MFEYHTRADEDLNFDLDREESLWYEKYEDPHMHARHRGTLEKRPQDDDFYTFDWAQVQ